MNKKFPKKYNLRGFKSHYFRKISIEFVYASKKFHVLLTTDFRNMHEGDVGKLISFRPIVFRVQYANKPDSRNYRLIIIHYHWILEFPIAKRPVCGNSERRLQFKALGPAGQSNYTLVLEELMKNTVFYLVKLD